MRKRWVRKFKDLVPLYLQAPPHVWMHALYHLGQNEGQNAVREWAESHRSSLSIYRLAPPPTPLVIPVPANTSHIQVKNLVIHIPNAFSTEVGREILEAWDSSNAARPKGYSGCSACHASNNDEHTDDLIYQQVLHLLEWKRYSKEIFTTRDTKQEGDEEAVYQLILLCSTIAKLLGPQAKSLVKQLDPGTLNPVTE
ncbi:hypothetical protein M231_06935 [Tremella mesenterica]|uniref:Uncharacterized protein n=1 Tax=Tremella mesenterica TaxID=5217 RepID=A0A4Q1BD57_TREME|nr:uncharacterized protein TREMEDRAFT_64076 [Tremella mesenterica DSM 1558]EIW67495.1 hypothetical protein TREMEDRAFT_64076 [Tremella mesenterica DSM 1558]RXK35796.1 hypothetical protein M231_06935 [Tremella mesenterica]